MAEKPDSDPHQCDKSDPHPHPHQSEEPDPDLVLDPHHGDADALCAHCSIIVLYKQKKLGHQMGYCGPIWKSLGLNKGRGLFLNF